MYSKGNPTTNMEDSKGNYPTQAKQTRLHSPKGIQGSLTS